MTARAGEGPSRHGAVPQPEDSMLTSAFRTRAAEVFGGGERSFQLAQGDAMRLWLAWRGDPAYLIAKLGDRSERESTWRVVRFTEVPELAAEHDHVEARGLGGVLPDHVLAHFARFAFQESSRVPGAEAEVAGTTEHGAARIPGLEIQRVAYGYLKAGMSLTIRWPSRGAPGLCSRVMSLSQDSIQDSKYPGLERGTDWRTEGDQGLTRFLARVEKKNQRRWVRRITRG